jgi:hypothetical protein
LRVKALNEEDGVIEKYVKASGKREKVNTPLFKDLMNKPLSLLIQMEESEYEGKTSWKPIIFGVCDANDFTASEILSKAAKAETSDKMLSVLKDKPMKPGNVPAPQSQHSSAPQSGNSFSDFESDIPF